MFQTFVFGAALALATLPAAAQAGPVEDSVIRQLRAQGFSRIEVARTMLGRVRIVARSAELEREIIVDPRTGEILRDYWAEHGDRRPGGLLDPTGNGDNADDGDDGDTGDVGDEGDDDNDNDDNDNDDDDGDDDDGDDDDDDGGDDDGDGGDDGDD